MVSTRILIDCLGCARFWPTISAIIDGRLMGPALQSVVRSLRDCTYLVALADISGVRDSAIGAGYTGSRRVRSMVSDAHHIFTEELFFILHLPQEGPESISCIKNPNRPGIVVEDWDVQQAAVPDDQPDIVKPIARTARDNVLRHHRCNCERAGASLTMSNLTNDVRLC